MCFEVHTVYKACLVRVFAIYSDGFLGVMAFENFSILYFEKYLNLKRDLTLCRLIEDDK